MNFAEKINKLPVLKIHPKNTCLVFHVNCHDALSLAGKNIFWFIRILYPSYHRFSNNFLQSRNELIAAIFLYSHWEYAVKLFYYSVEITKKLRWKPSSQRNASNNFIMSLGIDISDDSYIPYYPIKQIIIVTPSVKGK